jgi:hypothetical protein
MSSTPPVSWSAWPPGHQAGGWQIESGVTSTPLWKPAWEPSLPCRWAHQKIRRGTGRRCRGRQLKPLVKARTDLLGGQLRPLPLFTGDDDTGSRDTGEPGETEHLPEVHEQETLP